MCECVLQLNNGVSVFASSSWCGDLSTHFRFDCLYLDTYISKLSFFIEIENVFDLIDFCFMQPHLLFSVCSDDDNIHTRYALTTLFKLISVFIDVMTASIQMQLQNSIRPIVEFNLFLKTKEKNNRPDFEISMQKRKMFFQAKIIRDVCVCVYVRKFQRVALICISLNERVGHASTQRECRKNKCYKSVNE